MATGSPVELKNGNGTARALLLTLSAGAGAGLMHLLYVVTRSEPRAVLELMEKWGPAFLLAVILIYVGDRRIGELISINRENAGAQQRMADAIQEIATKDDTRAREMELVIDRLARNSDRTLAHLTALTRDLQRLPCQAGEKCEGERPNA